jgi:serine/threonine protein kinase
MTNIVALAEGTDLVGDYRVERVLGAGGFGITYLAREFQLDRLVTIKEYFPSDFAARQNGLDAVPRSQESAGDYRWGLERFVAEAQTLARFNHPHIVGVHRYFRANSTAYMVLHYEEGQSLKSWLTALGRVPRQADLDRVIAPLLDALETIHTADFLHRDIAPDNIIVRKDGQPVLIDFGSARGEIARHSKTISALVKPGYSPYEQYAEKNSRQGPWTDIYALGATLYFAVTKKRPPDSVLRVTKDEYRPVAELAMGAYRKRFLRAIDASLSVDIGSRPQSIAAWRGELLGPDKPRKSWLTGRRKPEPDPLELEEEDGPDEEPKTPTSVPPPPDAPGRRGGMLDFVDHLKKPHRPLAEALRAEAGCDAAVKTNPNKVEPQPPVSEKSDPEPPVETHRVDSPMPTPLFPKRHQQTKPRRASNPPRSSPQAETPRRDDAANPHAAPLPALLDAPRKPPRPPRDGFLTRGARLLRTAVNIVIVGAIALALFTYRDNLPTVDLSAINDLLARMAKAPAGETTRTPQSGKELKTAAIKQGPPPDRAPPRELRIRTIVAHDEPIRALAYGADGSTLITASDDSTLRIWAAGTGDIVRIIHMDHGAPTSLAVNDRYAATGHKDGTVSVWDLAAGTKIADLRRNEAPVWALTFTKSGRLAVTSHDWTVSLWDIRKPDGPIHVFSAHTNPVQAIALSSSGDYLASGGADKQVRLWSLDTLDNVRTYRTQSDFVTALAFSNDDELIASGTLNGRISIFRTRSATRLGRLRDHSGQVTALAFSPDGRLLVSTSEDGTVRIRETNRWRTLKTLPDHRGPVNALAFSPDGRTFASAGADGRLRIWATAAF